jgi:hypothetical protein
MKGIFLMDVVINANTGGDGFWSSKKELITIVKLKADYINEEETFMSLSATFLTDNWNSDKDSLIYTDTVWLKEFKKGLKLYGFTKNEISCINYSEQGRQGHNYVNLDCGKDFVKGWIRINGKN